MENDQSHTRKHVLVYSLDYLVGDKMVSHVTPPEKNVGLIKNFVGKTAFGIENSIANAEKFQAFMDYIAACDHPEIFEDVEMEGFENE